MTVAELIALLEQCDPEAQVRLMTQPSYPLQAELGGVARGEDFIAAEDPDWPTVDEAEHHAAIYLVEGNSLGYGISDAWGATL